MGYRAQRLRDFAWAFAAQRAAKGPRALASGPLVEHQQAMLGELVLSASEHSAFYRDRLAEGSTSQEVVLESIPPITKTEDRSSTRW